MPLFFFNHTSHDDVSVDESGTEFPSLEAAYLDTCKAILDISFEKLRERLDPNEDSFEIVSERGDLLVTIPFSEVLRPRQPTDCSGSPTEQLTATSARLTERHRVLKAEFVCLPNSDVGRVPRRSDDRIQLQCCAALDKSAQPSDRLADDQRVHLPGTFVGIDRFGVCHES